METVKMAVALQAVGFDVLGKGDTGKVYEFNWKATNNAVRFFNGCMQGDPVLETPKVPNLKVNGPQQK